MPHSRAVSCWPLITSGCDLKSTFVQNFGFSVTSSCGTFTLLGTWARSALALLTLLENLDYSLPCRGRYSLPFIICVRVKIITPPSFGNVARYVRDGTETGEGHLSSQLARILSLFSVI